VVPGIKEIQGAVHLLGEKIGAPKSFLVVMSSSLEDGSPHVEIKSDGFDYVCSERGCEIYRKHTASVDELLYWIMNGVAFRLASDYELAHRDTGVDSRRLLFSKYISLVDKMNSEWRGRVVAEVDSVLMNAPYLDCGV
jgi:hypothetical protein